MKRISLYNHIFWKKIAGTSFTNTNRTIYRPYYNGVKEELSDIKLFLRKYKGGSVDLEKRDNGICHVILNHPEKGNALSGKNSQLFFTGKYKVAAVSRGMQHNTTKTTLYLTFSKLDLVSFVLLHTCREYDGRPAGYRGGAGELGCRSWSDITRCGKQIKHILLWRRPEDSPGNIR